MSYLGPVLSLLGAFVGASVSSWFAYRRLYSEKWWDRKYQAYSDTLEALNSIRDDLETNFEAHLLNREVDDVRREELRKANTVGRQSIEKQRSIGGLVLGALTIEALKNFERAMTEASNTTNYFDHLDASLVATKEAIASVVEHGRYELTAKLSRGK